MRQQLLANHLGCDINTIKNSLYKENLFEHENSDYLVLSNEEADEETRKQITDTLWSLDALLIKQYIKTDISTETIEHIQAEMCPNCIHLLLALMENVDLFYKEIGKKFGRNYFIAFHDCLEHVIFEFEGNRRYYIYRLS